MPELSGWSKIDMDASGVAKGSAHVKGIEHLDFEPRCSALKFAVQYGIGLCEVPADFLITTHLCLFVGKRDPRMEPVFVCAAHLEHARKFMESSLRIAGRARCGYYSEVFSTFSDVVSRIVSL